MTKYENLKSFVVLIYVGVLSVMGGVCLIGGEGVAGISVLTTAGVLAAFSRV